jgi:choline dehydrogenase-like flavoprotein
LPERVDVLIAGTGFGGSISAFRLAELYRAAGANPANIVVLERGRRHHHSDFKQSMHVEHLSEVYQLIQGQGAQIVVGNGVGGGSALYLAASLRAPTETFERRDRAPGDGPERRMWPAALSRKTLNPYYRRAERGLRVNRPTWNQVSKSGGLWAATLKAAGHTCDRVPVAIDPVRCQNVKWCHTGCIFGAKNTVFSNYLASAEKLGVRVRPSFQVESVRQSSARPYRYIVTVSEMDNEGTRQPKPGAQQEIECKVLILSTGAMGNAPILMRSKNDLPALSDQVGKHLGVNGDHIAAIEYDPKRVRQVLKLPGYNEFYKGKPITTMTYDFWVGRRGHRFDGTRFNLQEIFLSSLTNFLYDDGRAPAGDPSWWGLQKKDAIAHWSNRIELLAMVEDTHDGEFYAAPPQGGAVRPNAGPVAVGTFNYKFSDQSLKVREAANRAMKRIAERKGLGRFMALTETEGGYASHPLGGCRMADSRDLGVTDNAGHVYGYEGLYCIDSSIIPSSLGVNPSLTIAAVSERCADSLVHRAGDLGLPARPQGFRPGIPSVILGPRVVGPGERARARALRRHTKPKRRRHRRRRSTRR